MTEAPPPRDRVALRWLLLAGIPLLALWLWKLVPASTDDPFRRRPTAWAVSPITGVKLGIGDDPRWADPAFDDSAWPEAAQSRLPWSDRIFWLRLRMTVAPPTDPGVEGLKQTMSGLRREVLERIQRSGVNALATESACAQEVFWHGQFIGRAGTPGDSPAAETPGAFHSYHALPTGLTAPGTYVLAVRLSHQHARRTAPYFIYLAHAGRLDDQVTRNWMYGLGQMGTMAAGLVGAAFSLVAWWLIERRPAFAGFTAFCLVIAAIGALHVFREVGLVAYPGFEHMRHTAAWLNLLAGALLLWTAAAFLDLRDRGWWLLLAVPPLVFAPLGHVHFFLRGTWPMQWFYAALLLLAAAGWSQRRRGTGWLAAAAVVPWGADLLGLQVFTHNFGDPWNVALLVLVSVALFRSIGLTLRSEQLRARQNQLTSARLETELLKRNIQPHFLLNSLGSIAQFVEENPAVASRMIDALADEFRLVSRVATQRLVPLAEELALCEAHLRVMSLRREIAYRLDVAVPDRTAPVPPALLHTLVENAITHGGPAPDGERVLRLQETRDAAGRRVLELFSPVQGRAGVEPRRDGTGTRYVKARLEESFPGRWHFETGPVPGGWRARIEIAPPPAAEEAR